MKNLELFVGAWRFSQRMHNWRHWLLLSQNLSVPTSLAEQFRGLKALLSWWLTQFCSGPLQVALDAVGSWLPRLCHVQKTAFHSLSPGLHPLNSLCLFFWNVSWTFWRLLLPQPWGPGWPRTCYVAEDLNSWFFCLYFLVNFYSEILNAPNVQCHPVLWYMTNDMRWNRYNVCI